MTNTVDGIDITAQIPVEITSLPNNSKEDVVVCTSDQVQTRVTQCISCDNFFIDSDSHSKCRKTGCNISFMTTLNYKSCPKGYW